MDRKHSSQTFYAKWQKGEPIRVLLVGWLFFALVLTLVMYAGLYWSVFGSIVAVGFPLCLAFGIFVAVKGRVESIVLAFLTFVLGILCNMSLVEYIYITMGETVRDISASEARNYPNGRVFELSDARLECQYEGAYVSVSRDRQGLRRSSSCFVCPLVHEGWTPGDPVPAWSEKEYYDEDEDIPTFGTFAAMGPFDRDSCDDAVKDALKKHGLDTFAGAPVLRKLDSLKSYQDYLGRARTAGLIMLLLSFGSWTLFTAIARVKSYQRPRSHNAAKSKSSPAQAALTTCPYCHASVRKDRLHKHKKKCPKRTRH